MVVEAVIRSAALPDRNWAALSTLLAPVVIDGLGTAVPQHRVDGDEVLRLITQGLAPPGATRQPFRGRACGNAAFSGAADQRGAPPPVAERAGDPLWHGGNTACDCCSRARNCRCRDCDRGHRIDRRVVMHRLRPPGHGRAIDQSPRPAQRDIRRMPFMNFGCAGGAASLPWASDWVRSNPGQTALVVAVEVPTLTFRPADTSADNLLSVLVFGDGAGAAMLHGRGRAGTHRHRQDRSQAGGVEHRRARVRARG